MFETVYKDMFIKALEDKLALTKQYLERRWYLCEWDLQKEIDKTLQFLAKKKAAIVRRWESMCRNMKKRLIFKMTVELRKQKIVELKEQCQKRTNEVVSLVELMIVRGNT